MKVKIIKSPAINAKKWKKGEDGLYIDGENDTLQPRNTLYGGIYYPEVDRASNQSIDMRSGVYPMKYKIDEDDMKNRMARAYAESLFDKNNTRGYSRSVENDIDNISMKGGGVITPEKAREILHHGTIHGKEITDKQRRFFGAISSNNKPYKMQEGGIVSMKKIQGDSHNEGGVDKMLNGVPVEVEGGETQINLADGSKAILNKKQMNMLRSGISLDRIIGTMPRNNVIADDGTFVDPDWFTMMQSDLRRNRSPYVESDIGLERAGWGGEPISYNTGTTINPKKQVQPINITNDIYKDVELGNEELVISPENKVGINKTTNVNSVNPNFFDRYNTNLGLSTISNLGFNIASGIDIYNDMQRNKKQKYSEPIAGISTSPMIYRNTEVNPFLKRLERSFNTANRMSRQSGNPEMVGSNLTNYLTAGENIMEGVNRQNLEGQMQINNMNIQNQARVDATNLGVQQFNKQLRSQEEARRDAAYAYNKQQLYNLIQSGINTVGQYGQNKLSSDILGDLWGKLSPLQQYQLMLAQT